MSTEKTLQKLRSQIEALQEELKNFSDHTVHPTVADAENLQSSLNALLESAAVFKFQKGNSEISPNFNLHAKVSEKAEAIAQVKALPEVRIEKPPVVEQPAAKEEEIIQPSKTVPTAEPIVEPKQEPIVQSSAAPAPAPVAPKNIPALTVGLNDKFRFINELFLQNAAEYNIVLEQLNTLQTWPDADIYISSLKNVYGWKDSHETFKYFCSVVRRRYDA